MKLIAIREQIETELSDRPRSDRQAAAVNEDKLTLSIHLTEDSLLKESLQVSHWSICTLFQCIGYSLFICAKKLLRMATDPGKVHKMVATHVILESCLSTHRHSSVWAHERGIQRKAVIQWCWYESDDFYRVKKAVKNLLQGEYSWYLQRWTGLRRIQIMYIWYSDILFSGCYTFCVVLNKEVLLLFDWGSYHFFLSKIVTGHETWVHHYESECKRK